MSDSIWITTVAALVLLAGAAQAGPAGGAGHSHSAADHPAIGEPGDPAKATRTIVVTGGDDMRYSPAAVTVKRGETVRIRMTNKGAIRHEIMLGTPTELREHAELMQRYPEMQHEEPNAVSVDPGETRELVWRFTRAGRIDFGCLMPGHYEAGMKGQILVKN